MVQRMCDIQTYIMHKVVFLSCGNQVELYLPKLESAEPYEAAFKYLEADDIHFVLGLHEKVYDNEVFGPPNHEDWVNVRKLLSFLRAFYNLALVVSRTKYVSAHLCFDEIFKIITDIRKMKISDDNNVSDMAGRMLQKLGKYWDEQKGNNAKLNKLVYIASVFDPRHKLRTLCEICFHKASWTHSC
ncbi:Zinc finger BED domain-containing protein DAYSLEEPER [Linum perenne]